jgi:hypothetical protein
VLKQWYLAQSFSVFTLTPDPSCNLPQRKKHTLVCRRHRLFVFDSNSKTTMGKIIKGAKERLVVKTVLGVVVPKRSVNEQLAINVCVGSQKCSRNYSFTRARDIKQVMP